jgi:Rrf2 family transcriptional regulator, iron-sulfur cluster assembly transcription factor
LSNRNYYMLLSKSCEYAIRATIFIAKKSYKSERSGIIEISEEIGSPKHFTAKILQILVRKNVILSAKGPTGGFYVDANRNLKLIDVIYAIDGNELFTSCALGLKKCSDKKPCPVHHQIAPVREQLFQIFSNKSVQDLTQGFDLDQYFLK